MPEDPSIGVTLPRLRKAEASMRVPTPEEVGVIMAAAEWWFRPFVSVCAFAGLRLGEAAALQADDIDFLTGNGVGVGDLPCVFRNGDFLTVCDNDCRRGNLVLVG